MQFVISEEQRLFLVAMLQTQAEFYLACNNDALVQQNRRITNDLLFIFDRPSEKQTKVGWAV